MRGRERKTPWQWGVGLLAVVALVLAGCGNSGSPSGAASGVTGSTASTETLQSAQADQKKIGKGKGKGESDVEHDGNNGKHKGRPEAELMGPVAGKSGSCPAIGFSVNGVRVRANGVTEFEGTSCATLANGNFVKIEGQPLGDGAVLAREITLLAPTIGTLTPVDGATVALVSGGVVAASTTTAGGGKFEFKDTAPGSYDLVVTLPPAPACAPPLATGLSLVAQRNEVEGKLATTATPPTCSTLALVKLEAKQGAGDD